jgi:hypothetical protein
MSRCIRWNGIMTTANIIHCGKMTTANIIHRGKNDNRKRYSPWKNDNREYNSPRKKLPSRTLFTAEKVCIKMLSDKVFYPWSHGRTRYVTLFDISRVRRQQKSWFLCGSKNSVKGKKGVGGSLFTLSSTFETFFTLALRLSRGLKYLTKSTFSLFCLFYERP